MGLKKNFTVSKIKNIEIPILPKIITLPHGLKSPLFNRGLELYKNSDYSSASVNFQTLISNKTLEFESLNNISCCYQHHYDRLC